jgi:hypothetical protein
MDGSKNFMINDIDKESECKDNGYDSGIGS